MSYRIAPQANVTYTLREIKDNLETGGKESLYVTLNVPIQGCSVLVSNNCFLDLMSAGLGNDPIAYLVEYSDEWADSRWVYLFMDGDQTYHFLLTTGGIPEGDATSFYLEKLITYAVDEASDRITPTGYPLPMVLRPVVNLNGLATAKPKATYFTRTPFEIIYGKLDDDYRVEDPADPFYHSHLNGVNVKGNLYSASAEKMLAYVAQTRDYPFTRVELFGFEISYDQLMLIAMWEELRPDVSWQEHMTEEYVLSNCHGGMDTLMCRRASNLMRYYHDKIQSRSANGEVVLDDVTSYETDMDAFKGTRAQERIAGMLISRHTRDYDMFR